MKAQFWEGINRCAVRLDYIPEIKKVSVTKIGPLGYLYNNYWNLEDFQLIDTQDLLTNGQFIRDNILEFK